MTQALPVSDGDVLAYHDLLDHFASRFDGWHDAEYDDLYQEGAVSVVDALRKGAVPSKQMIVGRMRRWVTTCARRGIGGYDGESDVHEA